MWQLVRLRFATRIALTTAGDYNLYVMDATSPHTGLEITGKISMYPGGTNSAYKTRMVTSDGRYAYVVYEVNDARQPPRTMLRVVDIWEPTIPVLVGSCELTPDTAPHTIQYMEDEEMVVVVFRKELSFVDVSDPHYPGELATQKFMGRAKDLYVHMQKIR